MFKPSRNIYTIKTSPYNDNEKLESLLNKMSKDGWELYSMQEIENEDNIYYNCIFIQEIENEDMLPDDDTMLDFRPRIERMINPELAPYELCIDILKKIKDKRAKISQVKSLIDETSEDSRALLNDEISKHINELEELKNKLMQVINPDIMEKRLKETKLSIAVSEELAPLLDSSDESSLLSQIVFARQDLTDKTGFIMPKIKIEIDDTLEENEFAVKVRGITAVKSFAYAGFTMFNSSGLKLEKLPDNAVKSVNVLTGAEAVWINDETAQDYWIKGAGAAEYAADVLEFTVLKYIEEIFDYSDVNRYIEIAGNQNMFLVENIIPDFLSIAELKYILTSLIKEKVSIKDIVNIFEKINDFAYLEDKEDLLAHLRTALGRQISASLCSENNNVINAFELSGETLKIFSGFEHGEEEEIIRIEKSKIEALIKKLQAKAQEYFDEGREIIIAAPMELRHAVYLVLHQFVPNIRVIARGEIYSDYVLKTAGKI